MSGEKGKGQRTSPQHPKHKSEPHKYRGRSEPFLEVQDLGETLGRGEIDMQERLGEARLPAS